MRVWLFILCLALSGCALIPSNESKTANARTAGNMEQEHEKTIRAFAAAVGTNGGSLYINGRTTTRTTDSEKFDYSYVRSLPVILTVGLGLIALAIGVTLLYRSWQAVKAGNQTIAAISGVADRTMAGAVDFVSSLCATETDPVVQAKLKSIESHLQKGHRKVNEV